MNKEASLPKEIKGLKPEPNFEAGLLQKHLGIVIKTAPLKIPLTKENRFALLRSNAREFFNTLEVNKKGTVGGKFIKKLNAFVYVPTQDEDIAQYRALHENMHAYVHEVNPNIEQAGEDLSDRDAIHQLVVTHNPKLFENVLIASCVNEGVAEWGASETTARIQFEILLATDKGSMLEPERQTFLDAWHKGMHMSEVYDLPPQERKQHLQSFVNEYKDAINAFMEFTKSKTFTDLKKRLKGVKKLVSVFEKDTRYLLGHYFVFESIKLLRNHGMPEKHALEYLLNHPPTTLDELSQPEEYVNKQFHGIVFTGAAKP